MSVKTTCPRRIEAPNISQRDAEGVDAWEQREQFANGIVGLHCSYCGSLHPDIFIALVKKGAEIIPTDKSYKAYIRYEEKETKFYYQHFTLEHANVFNDLYNQGQMKIGYPGHFYTKPFFLEIYAAPNFSFGVIVKVERTVPDGQIITLVDPFYTQIIDEIKKDPEIIYQIQPRVWEEIIAAAYDRAGFDEVILTPRSGDLGRDVIAIKKGFGSVKFIDQVKAYNPEHLVKADEVRAILGVLQAEQDATKAIFTTTSFFAPRIEQDKFIKPFLPYRLELIDKDKLLERLIRYS